MAGFSGMDPEVMRSVAQRIHHQATQLDAVITATQRVVDEAVVVWTGHDAQAFNSWWISHLRPALQAAGGALMDGVAVIERNIREQEVAGGVTPGAGAGGAHRPGSTSVPDLLGTLWPADVVGTADDISETTFEKGIKDLPGGGFLGPLVKGIGLGVSGSSMIDALQHGDYAGAAGYGVDAGVGLAASSPVGLLWSGLSEEVFFFIPRDYSEQDAHLQYMQEVRGLTPAEISERYSGVQGFIDLGNDNASRKAPWLVEGADRLLEKPAEWLYNAGIRL